MAFALKNSGVGDGERRNELDMVRKMIILPQSPSHTHTKKQLPEKRAFGNHFLLKKEGEEIA